MMPVDVCILRSPPFPAADPGVAGVSHATAGWSAALLRTVIQPPSEAAAGRALSAAEQMVARRIGGRFWAPPVEHYADQTTVYCPGSIGEAEAMIGEGLFVGQAALAVLPQESWSQRAADLFRNAGVREVHVGDADPSSYLSHASLLHTGGDDERIVIALAAGGSVRLWSDGVLAGWGVTSDPATVAQKGRVDRSSFLHAVLIDAARYRNPFTGEAAEIEQTIDLLDFWRRQCDANRKLSVACGIALWKRKEIESFLWTGRREPLRFMQGSDAAVAVWPSRVPETLFENCTQAKVPLVQVEDGFIRSVGLGSGLHPPLSVVVDDLGIYYDPGQPSGLETLLASTAFDSALIARAEALIATIVASGISKYSSGRSSYTGLPDDRRVILVTGQVEDDRSVRLGGADVAGNLDLLRRARAAEPDAYIVFKPHPDVEAGHRKGRISDADALLHADLILRDVSMPALLDAVQAVHVWTSLAGFEALLRSKEVVTHGSPFFAGWGLTRDLGPILPRRGRRLTLAELVAGALILYPRYLDPVTHMPCSPETLIERMAQQGDARRTWLTEARRLQGRIRTRLAGAFA
jgi:capsular polysaccharide export protein